jgi:hypothetical protein
MMDEICEAPTPTGYHSSDVVTVDNGADEPECIECTYHELRRLMRQNAAERAERVTAGSAGSGGPGGWCEESPIRRPAKDSSAVLGWW